MTNTYTAVIHKEDDLYVAECPEVGTVSQGESIEEAVKNLQEATELYLEEFPQKQSYRPTRTTFEVPVQRVIDSMLTKHKMQKLLTGSAVEA